MKNKLIMSAFYMSTSSSYSKEPPNSSNFSKFKSFSIISTKLEGGSQSILGSFDQFLFTKINLSKLFDYKQYLLRFVSMHVKKKILLVSICDLTIHKVW
jgi:hypothetical protein